MSRTVTAVLDRIVDGRTAVLLLEPERERESDANETAAPRSETTADLPFEQLDVDVETLPEDGRHEGAVFDVGVDVETDELTELTYRPEETTDRRERARDRFDRLSERLSDRDEE